MEPAEQRIAELEREFRRDGLPNLIVGLSASEDIFTRATGFLSVVFVVEVVGALDVTAGWGRLLGVLAGILGVFVAIGLQNVARGSRFVSIPRHVGVPGLAVFVLVPALAAGFISGDVADGIELAVINLVLLATVYVVIGFGVLSVLRWVAARLFAQLDGAMSVLVRAIPLLLFFSLVIFFNTEMWLSFTGPGLGAYWTAILLFIALAMLFLVVRLPKVVDEVQAESDIGDVPLSRRERVNLAAVALISQALQVLFVSAVIWLLYVVLGTLLVSDAVRADWLVRPEHIVWQFDWFGERLEVTAELLRVATGVATFAGLYYAVTILVDPAYRDQFVDSLAHELRDTFRRRAEYRELIALRARSGSDGESGDSSE